MEQIITYYGHDWNLHAKFTEVELQLLKEILMVDELAPPLTACGTHSRWRVHGTDGTVQEFYQLTPHICEPAKEVIPFLIDMIERLRQVGPVVALKVPGDTEESAPFPGRAEEAAVHFTDPLARVMYTFWPEIVPRAPAGDVAYDWEIWYAPDKPEGSFRRYGPDRRVVPIHDLGRRPLAELLDDLSISDDLAFIKGGV